MLRTRADIPKEYQEPHSSTRMRYCGEAAVKAECDEVTLNQSPRMRERILYNSSQHNAMQMTSSQLVGSFSAGNGLKR